MNVKPIPLMTSHNAMTQFILSLEWQQGRIIVTLRSCS